METNCSECCKNGKGLCKYRKVLERFMSASPQWIPIKNLPENWHAMTDGTLPSLVAVWEDQRSRLTNSQHYKAFMERMRRRTAIETGILERLYTIDRGTTRLLIERGIDEALISHDATDQSPVQVAAMIRDQEQAIEWLFDLVGNQRQLTLAYIRQLHQLLTQHQQYVEAADQFGSIGQTSLIRGDWKKLPNNPTRPDGSVYYYCPPEQTLPQMEQLLKWHEAHEAQKVSPEVEAAWLHHRFTQIHPFQDGNGRVARCLASLVFIRAGWFPLVITRDDREEYLDALETADRNNLHPLVDLFARAQRREFVSTLALSEQVLAEHATVSEVIQAATERLQQSQVAELRHKQRQSESYADRLWQLSIARFDAVAEEIRSALYNVTTPSRVTTSNALSSDERAHYYRYQIIETARALDYYANLRDYKSWINLSIRTRDTHTEFLVSFHVFGYENRGLMVCSACAYHKSSSEEENTALVQDIQSLSETPFQFSYADDAGKLEERFRNWLENALVVGLEYWRKGL